MCDIPGMSSGGLKLIIFIACGVAILSACERQEPKVASDEMRLLHDTLPGMTSDCVEKVRLGGTNAISSLSFDRCFEMAQAQTWRGLWRNEFEGPTFCPQPAKQCNYDRSGDNIWFEYSDGLRQQGAKPRKSDGRLYEIEFVGRITAKRGQYFAGPFDYVVIADRIISLRPVPAS